MKQEIKVLIVGGSHNERDSLKKYLVEKGYGFVVETSDGYDAFHIIESMKPHVVVTDIWLEGINGIRLMKKVKESDMPQKPAFVFRTSPENEELCKTMIRESNDAYILRPCEDKSVEKLISQAYFISHSENRQCELNCSESMLHVQGDFQKDTLVLEARVTELLQTMGMSAKLKGYRYLRSAIMFTVCEGGENSSMTKVIYPTVANRFGTTPSGVERAIRHAIENAWCKGDLNVIREYFHNKSDRLYFKPTNGEFIAVISDMLKIESKRTKLNKLMRIY